MTPRQFTLDCRRYAQHLRKRAQDPDDDLGSSSCSPQGTYFTIVRAFLDWCVKDERLDTNPARANRVKDALPENTDTPDQQFWTPDAREQLLRYVDDRAHKNLDDEDTDRLLVFRDRALVYAESAELAQEVLRHESIETTHKSYRDTRTEETRKQVEEILD